MTAAQRRRTEGQLIGTEPDGRVRVRIGELTANGRVRRAALLERYGHLLDQLYMEMQSDVS